MASSSAPLAARLRPTTLSEVVGHSHLVGEGAPLRRAVEQGTPFSFVLWGPPGAGKTTIARIVAHSFPYPTQEVSATDAGKAAVRSAVAHANTHNTPVILLVDEVHRFTRTQQDALLPHLEEGTIILIGATTEHPGITLVPPLLSRLQVFTLQPLDPEALMVLLRRGARLLNVSLSDEAAQTIARRAHGDARVALNALEGLVHLTGTVDTRYLDRLTTERPLPHDRAGDAHHTLLSAFIKSMRAGDPHATLYWLARLIAGGEDPRTITRRMIVFASEDVGLAQPAALIVATAVHHACEAVGLPECAINLAHGATYLALARKDRRAYQGLRAAERDVRRYGGLPVPPKLRNPATPLDHSLGFGAGYQPYDKRGLLPAALEDKRYLPPPPSTH